MEEIIDESIEPKKPYELPKNWKDLQILFGVILLIAGLLFLGLGIYEEIWFHDSDVIRNVSLTIEIKMFVMLILIPSVMITCAILLFRKHRVGWYGAMSTGVFIGLYLLEIMIYRAGYNFWVFFIALLCFGYALTLFARPYRKLYTFKWVNVVYIVAIPFLLTLFFGLS